MGLFDSLRDAIRPEGDPDEGADTTADSPKHLDESAPPEPVAESDLETPTGGKHARRDWTSDD